MSFQSTSPEFPSLLHASFADQGPDATLGAQLVNCDTTATPKEGETMDRYTFTPGYAIIGKLLGGYDSAARNAGVKKGDVIIAVNGLGFRRFAQDYTSDQVTVLKTEKPNTNAANNQDGSENGGEDEHENGDMKKEAIDLDEDIIVNHRVVPSGNAYKELLAKIKEVKAAGGDPPLVLTLERYGWDARPNCWNRFLAAREYNVPAAMELLQQHELWRRKTFPIHLVTRGMQKLIREKVISEIDIERTGEDTDNPTFYPPTLYIDYGKLLALQTEFDVSVEEIVQCFLLYVERHLGYHANDPRAPKTCHFIDFSGVPYSTTGFRLDTLKAIYTVFEPNYPETLQKLVIYPVSTLTATILPMQLTFLTEKSKKKLIMTNNLEQACSPLGWDTSEVEECGGIREFMYRHDKCGKSLFHD